MDIMSENYTEKRQIGDCTLYLGDCMTILPTLDKAGAVVTDPPYGIDIGGSGTIGGSGVVEPKNYGKSDWDKKGMSAAQWEAINEVSDRWIVWGGNHLSNVLGSSAGVLIWDKKCQNGWNDTFSEMEIAYTNLITRAKGFRHLWAGALRHSEQGANVREHPTQKPIKLMQWCIEFVPADQRILDPFMGSGTTGVACAKMGRKFIGIEIDPKYYEIACNRIEEAYKSPDMFVQPVAKAVQETMQLV